MRWDAVLEIQSSRCCRTILSSRKSRGLILVLTELRLLRNQSCMTQNESKSTYWIISTIFKVCDLVKDPFPKWDRPDLATLIFVLSAIAPEHHESVIQKIYDWMKPGSVLYFRDYGKYDFGQINLSRKKNRKLKENFYVKNDGVRVYYFTMEVG